jgi:putative oxidoreductase
MAAMSTAATPMRAAAPVQDRSFMLDDAGKLLLRWMLGGLMLLHGIAKVRSGIDPIIDAVANAGLPPVLAYGVFIGEVVAPLMLIVGWWTRPAALVIVVNMIVAIALMHGADVATLSRTGGWAIELQVFYLVVAVAIALLGAGRFAFDKPEARRSLPPSRT